MRTVFTSFFSLFLLLGLAFPASAGSAILDQQGRIETVSEGAVRALARVERSGALLDLRLLVVGEGDALPARVALADGQSHAVVFRRSTGRLRVSARRRGEVVDIRMHPAGVAGASLALR